MKKIQVHGYAIETEEFVVQEAGRNPKHRDSRSWGRSLKFVLPNREEAFRLARHIRGIWKHSKAVRVCTPVPYPSVSGEWSVTIKCFVPRAEDRFRLMNEDTTPEPVLE